MTLQENHHTDSFCLFVCFCSWLASIMRILTCSDLIAPDIPERMARLATVVRTGRALPESNPGRWEEEDPTQTPSGDQACWAVFSLSIWTHFPLSAVGWLFRFTCTCLNLQTELDHRWGQSGLTTRTDWLLSRVYIYIRSSLLKAS